MVVSVSIHQSWLQNDLLPAVVLLLGTGLLVRFAHWFGGRRRNWIDRQIRGPDRVGPGGIEKASSGRGR